MLEEKTMISKIASWVIWSAFTVVVAVFIYQHTNWISPTTAKAKEIIRPLVAGVLADPAGTQSSNEKIAGAREAFAHGDMERAITSYNDYIKNNAKNADVRGELGNVYYLTGRPNEAAEAYYDAAQLLLNEHDFERVASLIPIIAETQPMMANELSQKLRAATGVEKTAPSPSSLLQQRAAQSALTRY
jgi:tetratricopeptide (TPR) repeat protein